jgi:hypothetical protein
MMSGAMAPPATSPCTPRRRSVVVASATVVTAAACCAWLAGPSHAQGYHPAASTTTPTAAVAIAVKPTVATTSPSVSTIDPTAVAPGFVRLYDDTGTLTVVVPESWSVVETHELDVDGGVQRIAASPDLAAFQSDAADGVGINLIAQPYEADPQSLLRQYEREGVCQTSGEQNFDDGVVAGLAWLGTECGPGRQGSYLLVVASPDDRSVTYRLQARTATPADEPGVDMVLGSFGPVVPGTVTAATLPPSIVPAGSVPTAVATAFLAALARGDGAGACSLLNADYIGNFSGGIRNCAADLAAQIAGQGAGWATIRIAGDETTSSDNCGDEDPADEFVSLELQGPSDDGCLSIGLADGSWLIEDLSNSIWSQAAGTAPASAGS